MAMGIIIGVIGIIMFFVVCTFIIRATSLLGVLITYYTKKTKEIDTIIRLNDKKTAYYDIKSVYYDLETKQKIETM